MEGQRFSNALVVAPGAYETQFRKFHGTDQLTYKLKVPYPATETLAVISENLKQKGWRPLSEDFLNPGIPTSYVRGWTEFIDSTQHPEQKVYQWMSDWRNSSGDVVKYSLEYRYSRDDKGDSHLDVVAIYIPVNVAKNMQADAERSRREKPQ